MSVPQLTAPVERPALFNDTDLRRELGISERTFYRLKKRGQFKVFEVARPIGQRRYSRVLVDRYLAGESPAVLGGRR